MFCIIPPLTASSLYLRICTSIIMLNHSSFFVFYLVCGGVRRGPDLSRVLGMRSPTDQLEFQIPVKSSATCLHFTSNASESPPPISFPPTSHIPYGQHQYRSHTTHTHTLTETRHTTPTFLTPCPPPAPHSPPNSAGSPQIGPQTPSGLTCSSRHSSNRLLSTRTSRRGRRRSRLRRRCRRIGG